MRLPATPKVATAAVARFLACLLGGRPARRVTPRVVVLVPDLASVACAASTHRVAFTWNAGPDASIDLAAERGRGEALLRAEAEARALTEQERAWCESFTFFGQEWLAGSAPLATLGLDPDATLEQVKASHRRLVKVHHPDSGGDPAKFREVQVAYERAVAGLC